jgi:hypothetical protein
MAGFEYRNAGRSPGDIRRREELDARMRATSKARKKPVKPTTVKPTTVKPTTVESTTAERVTAEGRQDNARAQRLGSYTAPIVKPTTARFGVGGDKTVMHNGRSMANVTADQLKETGLKSTEAYMRRWDETGARPAAGAKDKYKDAAVPKRGGTGESPNVKALRKYVEDEGERRAAETDSLNKEHNAKKGAPSRKFFLKRDGTGESPNVEALRKYAKLEAARRADTREDAEKVENKPWWRFEKGGLVPKSIDGIATKGKTRAKHK